MFKNMLILYYEKECIAPKYKIWQIYRIIVHRKDVRITDLANEYMRRTEI